MLFFSFFHFYLFSRGLPLAGFFGWGGERLKILYSRRVIFTFRFFHFFYFYTFSLFRFFTFLDFFYFFTFLQFSDFFTFFTFLHFYNFSEVTLVVVFFFSRGVP